jgi:hypothetical protein
MSSNHQLLAYQTTSELFDNRAAISLLKYKLSQHYHRIQNSLLDPVNPQEPRLLNESTDE